MTDMTIIRQLTEDVGTDTTLMLMGIFKTDADTRIKAIRDCLANGFDVNTLRMQAHSLKGLCRTYGASNGGDAAMALQDACDTGEPEAIRIKAQAALDIIPNEVETVIAVVRTMAG